jgi:hypothetical protein
LNKKLTITVDPAVYEGLHKVIGRRRISRFRDDLARPDVTGQDLEDEYRAMAAAASREHEAFEWIEGVIGDASDEPP